MSMFDNYTQNTSGNNMHTFLDIEELDEIVIGGTATHIFTMNFRYATECDHFDIYYTQGAKESIDNPILHFDEGEWSKASPQIVYTEEQVGTGWKSYLTVNLTRDNTEQFINYRDTFAQLRLVMKTGQIVFGDINKVIVRDTLKELTPPNN